MPTEESCTGLDPHEIWDMECERARQCLNGIEFDEYGSVTVEAATRLLAIARTLAGIACRQCGGTGERTYSSTSTWRGGIGGQVVTSDVCDTCWGTGVRTKQGPDLRKLRRLEDLGEPVCRVCLRGNPTIPHPYLAACSVCGKELE